MQAALFDLDGTLCISDHLHYIAWREELAACSAHKDLSQAEVSMYKDEHNLNVLNPQSICSTSTTRNHFLEQ